MLFTHPLTGTCSTSRRHNTVNCTSLAVCRSATLSRRVAALTGHLCASFCRCRDSKVRGHSRTHTRQLQQPHRVSPPVECKPTELACPTKTHQTEVLPLFFSSSSWQLWSTHLNHDTIEYTKIKLADTQNAPRKILGLRTLCRLPSQISSLRARTQPGNASALPLIGPDRSTEGCTGGSCHNPRTLA